MAGGSKDQELPRASAIVISTSSASCGRSGPERGMGSIKPMPLDTVRGFDTLLPGLHMT